jgi:hypothetical protein
MAAAAERHPDCHVELWRYDEKADGTHESPAKFAVDDKGRITGPAQKIQAQDDDDEGVYSTIIGLPAVGNSESKANA